MAVEEKVTVFKHLGAVPNINMERIRQKLKEGYDADHDAHHKVGDLANFACCYILDPKGGEASNIIKTLNPFNKWFKPKCKDNSELDIENRIKDLIIGGALVCAEIDKLLNLLKEMEHER